MHNRSDAARILHHMERNDTYRPVAIHKPVARDLILPLETATKITAATLAGIRILLKASQALPTWTYNRESVAFFTINHETNHVEILNIRI
jgi:hypothetical protein